MEICRRDAIKQLAAPMLVGLPPLRRAFQDLLRPGLCGHESVAGFDPYCFNDSSGRQHQIYVAERHGPPVLLLHELPGLVDADLDTARRLADRGYTVVVPLLFGEPGGAGHTIKNIVGVCGQSEFACRHGEVTSKHIVWLRELCRSVRSQWTGGKGIGVVGMCLTGAFPIALMSETSVVAAVACQPSIPFGLFTHATDLGLNPADLDKAKKRSDVPILGLRYTGDGRSPKKRFERLVEEFHGRFYRLDLLGDKHSTIAIHCCPDAVEEVVAFLGRFVRADNDAAFPRHSRADSRSEVVLDTCKLDAHCDLRASK